MQKMEGQQIIRVSAHAILQSKTLYTRWSKNGYPVLFLGYRSYPKNKTGYPFLDHPVYSRVHIKRPWLHLWIAVQPVLQLFWCYAHRAWPSDGASIDSAPAALHRLTVEVVVLSRCAAIYYILW